MTIKANKITAAIIPMMRPIIGRRLPIATPTDRINSAVNNIKKLFIIQQKL